jgi:septal ring factor EnvC (AmiA/AmiB activator)
MQVNKKIDAIEALSNQLVAQDRKNSQLLAQDIAVIVKNTRNKPLTTTTKQGVCIPAPTFSDTLSNINQRANQSIKDKVQ